MSDKRRSRRDFLKKSALLGAVTASGLSLSRQVHAAGSDEIRFGVIGCGGRGMGASVNAMEAMPCTKLVAMGELFPDRAENARKAIMENMPDRVDVPDERLFTGLDAYKGVIESADVVLIACASRFHPFYAKSAVEAGKHVFVEKPHGIDALGVHKILEAAEIAEKNKTAFVSGLCYRYDTLRQEAVKRIKDGEIGEIVSVQSDYLRSPYSLNKREEGWSETEYQFRNWYHFTWLTGDDILQSLLHNLDSVIWALNEDLPESAYGVGGRSTEFIPEMGDIFDHNAVVWEYADGRRVFGMNRAASGCVSSNLDTFFGTKGHCHFKATGTPFFTDLAGNETWRPAQPRERDMYVQEHYEMINSILDGKPINDGPRMAKTTMSAILGMVACRNGQRVNYQELFDSNFTFGPAEEEISLDQEARVFPLESGIYPVPVPGTTEY